MSWRTAPRRHNPDGLIDRVVSVAWPTDVLAVATADSGRLLRSTDGGETWDDRRMFDSNSTPYVRMVDSLHGFVFLDYVPEPRTFTLHNRRWRVDMGALCRSRSGGIRCKAVGLDPHS